MKHMITAAALGLVLAAALLAGDPAGPPLGLPPLVVPADNPQTPEKIALGDKLFHDKRFSSDGTVSCATCHVKEKFFGDALKVSEGVGKLTGTRNAPTVLNAAYSTTAFWDGRSPSLEDQALHPFVNPVEMKLVNHDPILKVVRRDRDYRNAFKKVFGKTGDQITMKEVTQAIAAFERTLISGNSRFDRFNFAGQNTLTDQEKRGFDVFVNKGRCVSCHRIEQTTALFTDNRFHNVGVGINDVQKDVPALAEKFLLAKHTASEVDKMVLGDRKTSELGRFAVTRELDNLGSFKTPTLRNIALTAPYMHDGSLATLREVVVHYNNGGVTKEGDPVNDFLSGGIRPLNLTDQEIDDLVKFMEALTSPEFEKPAAGPIAATFVPFALVEMASPDPEKSFTFAYISDAHLQHIEGEKFVRNWDRGLIRAIAETNLLVPKPDFVVFGGDLAQLGRKDELDHGKAMLAKLDYPVYAVMGEHDYYLDLGAHWSTLFGDPWRSFDHKGVHFVILNSILTTDEWTYNRWPTAEQRMLEMAGLDNPNGSPFMVGEKQRQWLAADLAKVDKATPIVVFSHSPIQKLYKGWNFWTDDAEQVQQLLAPFEKVNVVYGHVHQIQYHQIGNIAFTSVMATAWPWPYPQSYAQAEHAMPKLTIPMNRADPFFERDATGWEVVDVTGGRLALQFNLYNNTPRVVAFNPATGRPEDTKFQAPAAQTPPQQHY